MKLKNKYILVILISGLVIALDLITKQIFGNTEFKNIIPNIINFETNHGNDGVAFGMFSGNRLVLCIVSCCLVFVLILCDIFFKQNSKLYNIGFSFMLGGAIGNLIDRLCLGYVRDFINFSFWGNFPTFNIADSFLTIGVIFICIHLLFLMPKNDGRKNI